MLRFTVQID